MLRISRQPAYPKFLFDGCSWITYASLPNLAGYRSGRGTQSKNAVMLRFAPEGRDDTPLNEHEIDLVRWLVQNEASVHEAMLRRIFDEYPTLRAEFLDHFDDHAMADEFLPEVETPNDLKPLLEVVSINVHQIESPGEPYVGVELNCTWDDEHGVGVLLRGTEVLEVGGADVAILLWVAREHARRKSG